LLSNFTTSDLEKEKLIEFSTPEGQEELYNYCNRPRRTILEVLQDFPHATANISLEYMFELFQPIGPRAFSIASSPKVSEYILNDCDLILRYSPCICLVGTKENCDKPVMIQTGHPLNASQSYVLAVLSVLGS
jgi:sulfite reductase alpha subunit-like flavoprotein